MQPANKVIVLSGKLLVNFRNVFCITKIIRYTVKTGLLPTTSDAAVTPSNLVATSPIIEHVPIAFKEVSNRYLDVAVEKDLPLTTNMAEAGPLASRDTSENLISGRCVTNTSKCVYKSDVFIARKYVI